MSTYYNHVGVISRGRGNSIACSLAYIRGERIFDKYLGEWHDNSPRIDVLYKDVVLPPSVPLDYLSPQKLADALNDSEQRIDSQMARSIILALPNEMNITQEVKLVREFIDQYFIANNMCAVFAIHSGRKESKRSYTTIDTCTDNPHAHIIAPIRQIGANGFFAPSWRLGNSTRRNICIPCEKAGLIYKTGNTSEWDSRSECPTKAYMSRVSTVNRQSTLAQRRFLLNSEGLQRTVAISIGRY